MKFKIKRPGFITSWVYEPKNKKHAESLMSLHRNMGDEIIILEEDGPEESEVSEDS